MESEGSRVSVALGGVAATIPDIIAFGTGFAKGWNSYNKKKKKK
ncbi:hypothetical protein ABEY41_21730 [Peribacillus butanolivorans]